MGGNALLSSRDILSRFEIMNRRAFLTGVAAAVAVAPVASAMAAAGLFTTGARPFELNGELSGTIDTEVTVEIHSIGNGFYQFSVPCGALVAGATYEFRLRRKSAGPGLVSFSRLFSKREAYMLPSLRYAEGALSCHSPKVRGDGWEVTVRRVDRPSRYFQQGSRRG